MTGETIRDILRWYKAGKSIDIIADLIGGSRYSVRMILDANGYPVRARKQYNVAMILHDWEAGVPSRKIAQTYGFPGAHNVARFVSTQRKNGYPFSYRFYDRAKQIRRLQADWNAGMPVPDMVKKYGYKHNASLCNVVNWHRSKGRPFAKRNGGVEKRRNNERGRV